MGKNRFNEAEKYLLQSWSTAAQLEETIVNIRKKYTEIYEQIAERLRAEHDLDESHIRVTQRWAKGFAGFGKKAWKPKKGYFAGFYIEYVRLETLSDETEPPACAYVWFGGLQKAGLDVGKANRQIVESARKNFTKEEMDRCSVQLAEDSTLVFDLPQSSKDLLARLIEDDGQGYIDAVLAAFGTLSKVIPAMDEVVKDLKTRRQN